MSVFTLRDDFALTAFSASHWPAARFKVHGVGKRQPRSPHKAGGDPHFLPESSSCHQVDVFAH